MANTINTGTPAGGTSGTPITGPGNQQPTTGSDLLSQLLAGVGTNLAQGNIQQNLLGEQLGMVNPQLNAQQTYNQTMSGYQAQNLGLSEQGLGISQLANTQQQQQAATQQGLEQQQYQLQSGQFPEQQAEAQLAYQNALMQSQGSQAIGGTTNTVGGRSQISTLGQQYGFQQQDIARAQALSQLGQKGEESQYGFSQQQLQNAASQLALNAKANGLSEQQLSTMLNYGQQQAGVGAAQNYISLLSQMASGDISQINAAGPALSGVGFAAGHNAIAGLNPGG